MLEILNFMVFFPLLGHIYLHTYSEKIKADSTELSLFVLYNHKQPTLFKRS